MGRIPLQTGLVGERRSRCDFLAGSWHGLAKKLLSDTNQTWDMGENVPEKRSEGLVDGFEAAIYVGAAPLGYRTRRQNTQAYDAPVQRHASIYRSKRARNQSRRWATRTRKTNPFGSLEQ